MGISITRHSRPTLVVASVVLLSDPGREPPAVQETAPAQSPVTTTVEPQAAGFVLPFNVKAGD
jgi:hypothetical protein